MEDSTNKFLEKVENMNTGEITTRIKTSFIIACGFVLIPKMFLYHWLVRFDCYDVGLYQNEVRGGWEDENSAQGMNSLSVINRIADMKNNGLDTIITGAPINHPNANSLGLLMMVSDLVSFQVLQSAYA